MTGERVGVGHDGSRGTAYVQGWLKALEQDPKEMYKAAADAQNISDYLMARSVNANRRPRNTRRGAARRSATRPRRRRRSSPNVYEPRRPMSGSTAPG